MYALNGHISRHPKLLKTRLGSSKVRIFVYKYMFTRTAKAINTPKLKQKTRLKQEYSIHDIIISNTDWMTKLEKLEKCQLSYRNRANDENV